MIVVKVLRLKEDECGKEKVKYFTTFTTNILQKGAFVPEICVIVFSLVHPHSSGLYYTLFFCCLYPISLCCPH